jgi:DNA-binding beta-propeller fold protein YncE
LPSIVSSAGLPSTISPCWAAATPNGKKVWSSNFAPGSLTLFAGKLNGSIRAVSTYLPASSSPGSLDVAVDQRGKFLYRLRAFDPNGGAAPTPVIETLKITNSTENGGLQLVQTVSLPADLQSASPTGIVITAP